MYDCFGFVRKVTICIWPLVDYSVWWDMESGYPISAVILFLEKDDPKHPLVLDTPSGAWCDCYYYNVMKEFSAETEFPSLSWIFYDLNLCKDHLPNDLVCIHAIFDMELTCVCYINFLRGLEFLYKFLCSHQWYYTSAWEIE